MFKHRTAATKACSAGHVKVNGTTVKASKGVAIGDRVRAVTPGGARELEIAALASVRGPASVAQALYIDHTPEPEPEPDGPWERLERERGRGRPTKRDRRKIEAWRKSRGRD